MDNYRYLIVGGGMTAHAAASAIRELDANGTIGLIGEDPNPPYARPPLSKGLWKGQGTESIWLEPVPGLRLHTGRRVVALDPNVRQVMDEFGNRYGYAKLLLATGARPRRLPFGDDRVIYFRTLEDYRRLREMEGRRVVVLGGGFIGSELAAALAMNGKEVTMIFPESAIGVTTYPPELARHLNELYRAKGVDVWCDEQVIGVEPQGERTLVRVVSGRETVADAVVAGLGVVPATELAQGAGLEISDGIEVDERCRTSVPEIYAAGDVACFPCPELAGLVRVEHEDNALAMGRTAGQVMAGGDVRYRYLPFFYSDLFELGYEAVGRLDPRLEIIANWKVPFQEGIVCYVDGPHVRGVLLWGIFGQTELARRLIRQPEVAREQILHAMPY